MKIIFNGQLCNTDDPAVQISPFSSAVQFGHSVFETFRTLDGRPPGTLKQHWERLFASARIIGLKLSAEFDQSVLDQAFVTLRSTLDLSQDYRCKILVTSDFWWLKAETLKQPPAEVYTQGVVVDDVVQYRLFPGAKMASPLYPFYQAHQRETGVFETLFFSEDDQLLEANTSNVIAVINGQLVSPGDDVLPGVTVRSVFAQAESLGLKTEFCPVSRTELESATEIFLTSAVKGLVPVRQWGSWARSGTEVYDQLQEI